MRRAKCVVDEEIAAGDQLPRELRIVGRLALVEARVLEDVEAVVGQELTEMVAHRRDREALVAPFRPTEVGTDTYFRGASFE